MSASLADQVAVVTGAAHGIGRALAGALHAAGARVALLDLDVAAAEAAAAELGPGAAAWACDVTDPERCRAVMGEIVDRLGGVDVVVNNAGLSHHSRAADTSLDVLDRVMGVNFRGAVHVTLAALPQIRARRGVVVAMSSVAGFAPLVDRSAYCASKHALHGWFDTLRAELADEGVHVLVVCPSFVATGIDERALGGDGQQGAGVAKATVGRPLTPEDVARAVVDAVAKRRRQLVLGPVGRASWWISRVAPRLYERVMRRSQQRREGG